MSERRQLTAELQGLCGAWVQKISVASARIVSLELRLPGRSIGLRLDATPGLCRAGVVTDRLPAPLPPHPFQAQLRAQLDEAQLTAVATEGRTISFAFQTGKGVRRLVLELDRRAGDVLLLDGRGVLLGWGDGEGPRARHLRRGGPYQPPPAEGDADRPSRFASAADGPFPVSAAIAAAYATAGAGRAEEGLRTQLRTMLRANTARLQRTIDRVGEDLRRMDEAERFRQWADLLKPQLGRLNRGLSEVRVIDYAQGEGAEVLVPLLPALSPHENVERYYHLHKRLTRSRTVAEERLSGLVRRLERLQALQGEIDAADPARLREIDATLQSDGFVGTPREVRRQQGNAARRPYRLFRSVSGQPIWVGRTAQDNDALTFALARGNDPWLHVRGLTGSHVVLPGIVSPDGETLLDAATLAAHFSAARGEPRTEVVITARKHVRRLRDAPPGAVTYSQERSIALRLEPDRLARLLASEQAPS